MKEWISVKERLPDLKQWVLVYEKCTHDLRKGSRVMNTSYRFKMSNCDIEKFECENMYWKVTHWTPLPNPPKETT
jgi:hypothetical protein